MNTLVNKLTHLPPLVGGIAAILVSGIAIASLAISGQGFQRVPEPAGALEAAAAPAMAAPAIAAPAARARRCAECGVIESIQEIKDPDEVTAVKSPGRITNRSHGGIAATPLRNYEITIRLQDGSMHMIRDAKPAKWRRGEPVTLIAGVN